MKFVLDEHVKHRIIGIVVLLSIAALFVTTVMQKSTRNFEENMTLSVRLPAKPQVPKVAVSEEKTVFQSLKVAHVELPAMPVVKPIQIAKAEPLSTKSFVPSAMIPYKKPTLINVASIAKLAVKSAAVPVQRKLAKAAVAGIKKQQYAIQLGSFSQQNNATSLVQRLKKQGFAAMTNKQGAYYKVIVGQVFARDDALRLQKKLIANMQLKGILIKTGES